MSDTNLGLSGPWRLATSAGEHACTITIPGDVQSALHAANIIADPYFGRNEEQVEWGRRGRLGADPHIHHQSS